MDPRPPGLLGRRRRPWPWLWLWAVAAAAVLGPGPGLAGRAAGGQALYTNTWAVRVPAGPEAAAKLARKHGFVNFGQVSGGGAGAGGGEWLSGGGRWAAEGRAGPPAEGQVGLSCRQA